MWAPDLAYVISLRQRDDRRRQLAHQLPKLGFPVELVDAHDGLAHPPPPERFYNESPQAWGASRSHVAVLERARAAGAETVLVLEDDVEVDQDFPQAMTAFLEHVPPDWEALMLGGEHIRTPRPVAPGVVRCTWCIRTHAYVLRGPVIADMQVLIERATRHYDIVMGHRLGRRLKTFAPDSFLLHYSGSPSSIPDSNQASPYRLVMR